MLPPEMRPPLSLPIIAGTDVLGVVAAVAGDEETSPSEMKRSASFASRSRGQRQRLAPGGTGLAGTSPRRVVRPLMRPAEP